MSYAIVNGSIYTETGRIPKGYLIVEEDTIKEIKEGPYTGDLETIDAEGQHILPGFIDIHIHGGYGEDAMDASYTGPVSYTHLTLPTTSIECRSRWSPYH